MLAFQQVSSTQFASYLFYRELLHGLLPTIMNVFRPWECNSSGKPSSVAALHPLPIHQPQISADITIQHQHLMTSLHDLRSCKHHNMRLIMSHYLLQVNQIEQCRSYDLLMTESHQQTSRINWSYNQQRLELVSRTLPYLHSCTPAEPIMNPVQQHRPYNSPGASRRTLSKATVNVLKIGTSRISTTHTLMINKCNNLQLMLEFLDLR